jgi:hypothetical protein
MNKLIPILLAQTDLMLQNVAVTLGSIREEQLSTEGSWGWPLGEQIFHLLHSLDQWFINPFAFTEPSLAMKGGGIPDAQIGGRLSAEELMAYFTAIRNKIFQYFSDLREERLPERPEGCPFTRLELILGQSRHLMYHIGLIHGCLRSATGKSPEYIGLSGPIPPVRRKGNSFSERAIHAST